ncbi:MAG: putative metal-binding motif-containing protein [Sandaracinus sp.]|nr:putative metal-binding motif-containing protein [Sandaracinus sp.]MCB9623669.1 putative metal-binding motif-containing protein [Sandaracinus sp.]MCB9630678.1 putative metal-binding motif-containing protein [Sandaracinus sp.]
MGFGDDCDDTDPDTYPGAPSLCDGRDRDCDGTPDVDGEPRPWYLDRDRDGHGDPDDVMTVCAPPAGRVTRGDDCDDSSAAIAPGAVDRCGGGDEDCDGTLDEDAAQIAFYADGDGDGSGGGEPVLACVAPSGHGLFPTDCADADASRFPGGVEVCDGDDEDCDGSTDEGGDALCLAPGATARCTAAGCVIDACTAGLLDCDRDPSTGCEVDPSADSAHCGACDVSCGPYAHASGMCVAGACDFDCGAGFADSDLSSANDCESELLTSPIDCGACGNRCPAAPNAMPACAAGSCTIECTPGFEDASTEPCGRSVARGARKAAARARTRAHLDPERELPDLGKRGARARRRLHAHEPRCGREHLRRHLPVLSATWISGRAGARGFEAREVA